MEGRVFGFQREDIEDFQNMAQSGDFTVTVSAEAYVRRKNPRTGKMCRCYTAQLADGTQFYMTPGFYVYVFLPATEQI